MDPADTAICIFCGQAWASVADYDVGGWYHPDCLPNKVRLASRLEWTRLDGMTELEIRRLYLGRWPEEEEE